MDGRMATLPFSVSVGCCRVWGRALNSGVVHQEFALLARWGKV